MNPGALLAMDVEKYFISFPKLGINLENINPVAFRIGSFAIRWYGIIICLGLLLCVMLGMRKCKKYAIKADDLLDYIIIGIPAAIIGARIYYVAFSWKDFSGNLKEIFAIWKGGLAIYGAVIAIAITAFIICRVKKIRFLHILDFALPYVMLGQAIGRWGNFFNQEAFGGPTNFALGMTGNLIARKMGEGVTVHPTFLYESLWCFAGFAFIAIYRQKLQKNIGEVSALYMIVYGAERALVEGLRTDSLMLNIGSFGIRVSQWLSVALVIVGIALFIDSRIRGKSLAELREEFAQKLAGNDPGSKTGEETAGETAGEPEEATGLAAIARKLSEAELLSEAGENSGETAEGAAGEITGETAEGAAGEITGETAEEAAGEITGETAEKAAGSEASGEVKDF